MSRPQVTITLGRSGQVVKRAAPVLDTTDSDYMPATGSKRPVRERLGSNVDNPLLYSDQLNNKRQRRNNVRDDKLYVSNNQISRDDLRLKLNRKKLSRTQSDGEEDSVDLREKLSRAAQAPVRTNAQQRMLEQKETGFLRQIPPRTADDLIPMGSLRKSYSAWTLDGLRRKSPERNLDSSRGISPTRNVQKLRQPLPIRSVDTSRSTPFINGSAVDTSRSTAFMTKAPVTFEGTKPVMQLSLPTSMIQKSSCTAEEPLTVSGLLHSLGLGKYSILFQAEEVDMTALKQMGDNDLKELGIPMGPRKKILLAVLPRSKQRQSREV